MGINVKSREKVSEQLENLNKLISSGEQLFNDDSEVEEWALKYVKWSNHCEVILENSIGVQYFVNKFKEAKNHGPTSLNKEGLANLLSINIDCLKSFYESIAGREMGIWRAKYLDITLFFKETWFKLWENIADALGMLVLLVVLIVGIYGLNYIFNRHPRINKIAHKVECNQYGVCDK